ncbi:MAG: methyl-accepting chemotaxis protein [Gammaproteobacteria bacterium]|nr:methyl-accepting chemotaxis protein [Gammaproteobacteria bacterium]
MFNQVSIRKKIIVTLTSAVLLSALAISWISVSINQTKLSERMLEEELPATLKNISQSIDAEVSGLSRIAEQLATSGYAQQWLADGKPADREAQLIKELTLVKAVHGLQAASFCERTTGDYWNERGFLRRLNPTEDSWFFAFKESGKAKQVSVYKSAEVGYQIFVNYQQLNGVGLSGVAKSMNDMVKMLSAFKIEQTGFVFLVDKAGKVQIHPTLEANTELQSTISAKEVSQLLASESQMNLLETELNGKATILASLYIPSMDWYLVAQVPQAEVFAMTREISKVMWGLTALIALIFLVISVLLSNSITAPINHLAALFKRMGEGETDLSVHLSAGRGAELDELASGFNAFISKVRQIAADIQQTSTDLAAHAATLNQAASQSYSVNREQQLTSREVTEAIRQMEATVAEIASNAANAAQSTSNASANTATGMRQVQQSMQQILALSANVKNVENVTSELATQTLEIDKILTVIQAVAEQTNLLALNAAIEAARAGEQGRGFAVVADEVRHLAARTQQSTAEINQVILKLRSQSQTAVAAVSEARNKAETSAQSGEAANAQLAQITHDVGQLEAMNIQIAAATEEQSMVAASLNAQLNEMNQRTEANVQSAQALDQSAKDLAAVSSQLAALAGRFGLK